MLFTIPLYSNKHHYLQNKTVITINFVEEHNIIHQFASNRIKQRQDTKMTTKDEVKVRADQLKPGFHESGKRSLDRAPGYSG